MRTNLAATTVVVSWWDYGYWCTVIGNVTTVNDNGTDNATRMGLTGMAMMQTDELASARAFRAAFRGMDRACAQREFARAVRRIDPHRLLITGDSIPRPYAYHLMKAPRWERDTPAQTAAMLLGDNADPYDSISIHLYPNKDHEFFEPRATLRELMRFCQETAVGAGKPLFVGEFGASEELGADKVRQYVTEMLDTLIELRVPLSALWVYDLSSQDGTYNVTSSNNRAWMLDAVGEANRRVQGN